MQPGILAAASTLLTFCDSRAFSFSVWNSAAYRKYRRDIRETQKSEVMCQRCAELVREELDPGVVFTAAAGA